MNPKYFKLFLALLWLFPGLAFLALDAVTGQTHALTFGSLRLPLGWVFMAFAAFNLVRWWTVRPARAERLALFERRRSRPRRSEPEPDSAFRFDEPPAP